MPDLLTIDGSQGEGGGQVLRTSLALAATLGRDIRIRNVRASRPRPGLLRQHLAAVRAAATVACAEVEGDTLGSTEVVFRPQGVQPGRYAFSVGSSGSACLVLQTVLPPLLTARGPSHLRIEGGTHNPWAPPFDFLERAFLPLIGRMGPQVRAELVRAGFHPVGGGLLEVSVEPAARLEPLHLLERGRIRSTHAQAVVAGLPLHVAQRELAVLGKSLDLSGPHLEVVTAPPARGPANVLLVDVGCEHVTEVFAGFGRKGLPAERVARDVAQVVRRWRDAEVPAGEHLADQLLLPLALAGGGSFRTLPLSSHGTTNRDVIRAFLDLPIEVTSIGTDRCEVRVG